MPLRGSGRRRAAPPREEAAERARRRLRAVEEPLDVRVRRREPYLELEVRNPVHRTSYRVLLPAFPSREAVLCTCPDFARRGLGTCKHAEAAWGWLELHPDLPGGTDLGRRTRPLDALWASIDRRLDELRATSEPDIRAVERPGAVLFEEADGADAGRA